MELQEPGRFAGLSDADLNGGGAAVAPAVAPREIEVLRLAPTGLTSRQIGEQLG